MEKQPWKPSDIAAEKQRKKKALQQKHNADHMLGSLAGEVPPVYSHLGHLAMMAVEGGKAADLPEAQGKAKAIETFGQQTYVVFDAFAHAQGRRNNGH